MKRHGNIFEKIVDMENIKNAHKNARRGKSFYKEVKMVDSNVDFYIDKIQKKLIDGSYTTSNYEIMQITDRDKIREIHKLPYYPDRIVHWAIMLQIESIFLKNFISTTYASIPNRGIHKAFKDVKKAMLDEDNTVYCLKIDIKKFFPSIDKDILKKKLKNKFKDKKLLALLNEIVESCDNGVPIGNYLSQYFGNFYLSDFDHFVKEKCGIKYYFRYMDDCVFFHEDKDFLHKTKRTIESYLKQELNLHLKENWQVFKTRSRGLDFVGYRFFGSHIKLRKRTSKKLIRKIKRVKKRCKARGELTYSDWCSVNSYKGWIKWCNSFNLNKKYIETLNQDIKKLKI